MRRKGYHFIVKWIKKNFFFPRKKAWRRKKIDKHNLVSFLFSHFVSFESDLLRVFFLPVDEREGFKKMKKDEAEKRY